MPDYREMYLTLCRATERAIRELIAAQQRCEELYMQEEEAPILLHPINNPAGDCDSEKDSR